MAIDLQTATMADIERMCSEMVAAKKQVERRKQAIEEIFAGQAWQEIKGLALECDIDAFMARVRDELPALRDGTQPTKEEKEGGEKEENLVDSWDLQVVN